MYETNPKVHLMWAIVVAIAVVVGGVMMITAVRDNGMLSKAGYEQDMKAYQTCIEQGKWTPVECRAGIYGAN